MQKRLHYAMPRIPLKEHRQKMEAAGEASDDENEVILNNMGPRGTNVDEMAKRIGEAARKKRKVYRAPPEQLLAGDLESSDSEVVIDDGDGDSDDEDEGRFFQ